MRMAEKRDAPGWRIVGSEIVIETPHLRLRRDEVVLPSGRRIENYYVRESRGFSVVFALTPDDRVVLVRQYKHGIGRDVLELPAGAIDPDETPLECARREFAEETGFCGEPDELEHLATFATDPTNSDAHFHLFLVRNARPAGTQRLDVTEAIEVRLATFEELRRFVRDGTIEVSSHVAAVYYVLDRLGKL
jgi:ADP-ribose diphosphatase